MCVAGMMHEEKAATNIVRLLVSESQEIPKVGLAPWVIQKLGCGWMKLSR